MFKSSDETPLQINNVCSRYRFYQIYNGILELVTKHCIDLVSTFILFFLSYEDVIYLFLYFKVVSLLFLSLRI